MRAPVFLIVLCLCPLIAAEAPADKDKGDPARPQKAQIAAALRKRPELAGAKAAPHVSAVLDAVAGRYPVLFTMTESRCERNPVVDDESEKLCFKAVTPYAALVGPGGEISGIAALPLTSQPAESGSTEERFTWGVNLVRDYDGDGKPELLVIYAYPGVVEPALGTTVYRDLALINLEDSLKTAAHVNLRRAPEAETLGGLDLRYKFQGAGATAELLLTGEERPEIEGERQPRAKKVRRSLRWDSASDTYKEQGGKPAR